MLNTGRILTALGWTGRGGEIVQHEGYRDPRFYLCTVGKCSMVTYLIGTDGAAASEAIGDYLDQEIDENDHLEVINVLSSGTDADENIEGREALDQFEERFGGRVAITTHQLSRGQGPTDELVNHADEIDADRIVIALRRHSRTERIIFGSVSHTLLQRTTRPITLIPLPEYQSPAE